MENLQTVSRVYPSWAGESYEPNQGGNADEIAKRHGFTIAKETKRGTRKDGTTYAYEKDCYQVGQGGYDWSPIYFELELTKEKAKEYAERHGSALDDNRRAELADALSISYTSRDWSRSNAGQAKDWEDMDAADVSDGRAWWTVSQNYYTVAEFEFTEADDESPEELAKEKAASDKAEAEARAFCDAFNAASEELQDDARDCQSEIDDAEREDYESDCENDSDRATFDAWKEANGIESELEVWDCETNEKEGEGVYQVTDEGRPLFVRLTLEKKTREVSYLSAE